MKAICVSHALCLDQRITVGNTYEALQGADGRWAVIDDYGDLEYWILEERFSPVPDPIPEPVNEWMQIDSDSFINMKTGMTLEFNNESHDVKIENIYSKDFYFAQHEYAEAFAQMVGYKWEE